MGDDDVELGGMQERIGRGTYAGAIRSSCGASSFENVHHSDCQISETGRGTAIIADQIARGKLFDECVVTAFGRDKHHIEIGSIWLCSGDALQDIVLDEYISVITGDRYTKAGG